MVNAMYVIVSTNLMKCCSLSSGFWLNPCWCSVWLTLLVTGGRIVLSNVLAIGVEQGYWVW